MCMPAPCHLSSSPARACRASSAAPFRLIRTFPCAAPLHCNLAQDVLLPWLLLCALPHLRLARTLSSALKSGSLRKVPRPKSFSYESLRPSARENLGVHPSSAWACTHHGSAPQGVCVA